ncbi:MAG: CotH kinase family protein [Oscillospiraceae bacterium]|nr:CotH kinase family protein [Oscillospiraceae bacterium]
MSVHRHIDRICIAAVVISLVISIIFMNGSSLGIQAASKVMGYENRLFDTSRVHTIDIVMDDWDSFIESCENEEYADCTVIIDGESYKNTAIRAKGNTSLSSVKSMNSSRYSFKVEFDHYDSNKTYYGLDKLSLNNVIQDNTFMKDYLTYRMMYEFGADAPLCSYAFITVNGEDWGLYLAAEGIEDSFLQRNYGTDHGELYKPDSMSFGGGRGNGKDFDMNNFMNDKSGTEESSDLQSTSDFENKMSDFTPPEMSSENSGKGFGRDKMGGGMGSNDVKLKYTDDNYDSYSNIFENAKTDVTDEDKSRLISSLKALNNNESIDEVVDVDEVLRYFVVHNYVCNGDSYTGSIIHNYYLYEEDGRLSMIPWDYNLAFGTFHGGNASEQVNFPIDTPVSGGETSDRPMLDWIFENTEYTEQYHKLFREFTESVDIQKIIDETAELIAPYVEKDPTKFCTYDEFEEGIKVLAEFCTLRTESVKGQLDGAIPSTSDGQSADSSKLVETSGINLSAMGSMNQGMGGGNKGFGGERNFQRNDNISAQQNDTSDSAQSTEAFSFGMSAPQMPPDGFGGGAMPNGEMPEGMAPGGMPNGEMPEGVTPDAMPDMKMQDKTSAENSDTAEQREERRLPSEDVSTAVPDNNNGWMLLGVSSAALIAGLVFAIKFKR